MIDNAGENSYGMNSDTLETAMKLHASKNHARRHAGEMECWSNGILALGAITPPFQHSGTQVSATRLSSPFGYAQGNRHMGFFQRPARTNADG